jgi:hypothetical protein
MASVTTMHRAKLDVLGSGDGCSACADVVLVKPLSVDVMAYLQNSGSRQYLYLVQRCEIIKNDTDWGNWDFERCRISLCTADNVSLSIF